MLQKLIVLEIVSDSNETTHEFGEHIEMFCEKKRFFCKAAQFVRMDRKLQS